MNVMTKGIALTRCAALLAVVLLLFAALLLPVRASAAAEDCTAHTYCYEKEEGILRKKCSVCGYFDDTEFYNVRANREQLTLSDALSAKGYTAVSVRNELKQVLTDRVDPVAPLHYRFFDLELRLMVADGETTAQTLPAGATVEVSFSLASLDGFEEGKYALCVVRMLASDTDSKRAGDTEIYTVEDGTLTVEDGMLSFKASGLSPIIVGWTCANHADLDRDGACDNGCGEMDGKKSNLPLFILLAALLLILLIGVPVTVRIVRRRREERELCFSHVPSSAVGSCATCMKQTTAYGSAYCTKTPPTYACSAEQKPLGCRNAADTTPPACPASPINNCVGYNSLSSVNPIVVAEWHPCRNGNLKPCNVSGSSSRKVWWLCKNGHEWQSPVYIRNAGRGCPYCSGKRNK